MPQRPDAVLAGDGVWALQGERSSYVLALDADRTRAELLHWGPRLTEPLALIRRRHVERGSAKRPPADLAPVEYAPWGVRHLTGSDLLAVYPDGVRGSAWRFAGAEVEGDELRLAFADTGPGLRVTLRYRAHPAEDAVERWVEIENRGGGPVTLEHVASAAFNVPLDAPARATYLSGSWIGEFGVRHVELGPGTFAIESRSGMTEHAFNPWIAIRPRAAGGDDARGDAWSVALAWSGSWRVGVECPPEGGVRVDAGVNPFDAPLTLEPGGRHRAPSALGLFSDAGLAGVRHRLHAYERRVARCRDPLPVLYNSWESTHFDVDVRHQTELARRAAGLGCEVFVVDDGWFRGRDGDHAGLGDWDVDGAKFPNGLEELIGEVRRAGMKFGLWVEPEGVNPDSDLYRAHPEWTLRFEGRPATRIRNQVVLNLAHPDAAAWIRDRLLGLLDRYPISYLKWDMNRPLTEPGWAGATPAQARTVWLRYVEHLYAILDELRRRHPDLLIEGCAGGGGRVDLGMLAHVDTFWTSDNTGPIDRLRIQHGVLHAYPPRWMSSWVTDSPGRTRRAEVSLAYRFCVAMAGALGIGADIEQWSGWRADQAGELVQLYKDVRPTIQGGRVDLHGEPDDGRPYAVQYTAEREVVVLVWWDRGLRTSGAVAPGGGRLAHDARPAPVPARVRLAGLDPDARYRVRGDGAVLTATELMHVGLVVPWRLADDADLVVLERA